MCVGTGDERLTIKWIRCIEVLGVAERDEETIGDEFDVLAHELLVHADELDGESGRQELLFDLHSLLDDGEDSVWVRPPLQVREEQASEICVKTFVSADEFVGESQAGHQATLLEPEDGSERAREEDSLYSSKGNDTFAESRIFVGNPLQCPVCFSLDAWHCLDGVEETCPLCRLADVCVDEEGVYFGMDVFAGRERRRQSQRGCQYIEGVSGGVDSGCASV